jgi:hypothetical protein
MLTTRKVESGTPRLADCSSDILCSRELEVYVLLCCHGESSNLEFGTVESEKGIFIELPILTCYFRWDDESKF